MKVETHATKVIFRPENNKELEELQQLTQRGEEHSYKQEDRYFLQYISKNFDKKNPWVSFRIVTKEELK